MDLDFDVSDAIPSGTGPNGISGGGFAFLFIALIAGLGFGGMKAQQWYENRGKSQEQRAEEAAQKRSAELQAKREEIKKSKSPIINAVKQKYKDRMVDYILK